MRQVQAWGVTGWSTEWASLEQVDDDGSVEGTGFGFTRLVEPGVIYTRPPVVGDWACWTESPGSRQRRYQMAWPEDEQPAAVTVLGLHEQIAPRRPTLAAGDEQLRQLDESLLEAVRQVERLHRAGGTLGFVQPDSVVFCRLRDGTLRVIFPDVGFAWDELRALREPKWLAEPQLDCLFEDGPRRQNAACLAAFRDTPESVPSGPGKAKRMAKVPAALLASQAADVRALARLIAVALAGADEVRRWCGSGRAFLAVPGRDRAPDTQAPVWDQVIAPALLDKITTAAALLERLELALPSEHFLFRPPKPPPAWRVAVRRTWPGLIGATAILALVLIGKPALDWVFPRREPHRLCDTVYHGDPGFARLDLLEKARSDAKAGDLDAIARYWDLLAAEAEVEVPAACLGKLRDEAAKMIGAEVLTIPRRIREGLISRTEQVTLLQRAYGLAVAADEVSPGSCQRAAGLLARQLEARGQRPNATRSAVKAEETSDHLGDRSQSENRPGDDSTLAPPSNP